MSSEQQHNQLVFELAESTIRLDYVYNPISTQDVYPNVVIQPNIDLELGPLSKMIRAALGDIVVCYPATKMLYWWVYPQQSALINLLDGNEFIISAYSLFGNVSESMTKIQAIYNTNLVLYTLDNYSEWQHTYLPMLIHDHQTSPEHHHNKLSQVYIDALNAQIANAIKKNNKSSTVICLHLLGKPIGFVFASIVKNLGLINLILLNSANQGNGYGKHLYYAALNWFKSRDVQNYYGTTINEHILKNASKQGRKVLHVKLQKELST